MDDTLQLLTIPFLVALVLTGIHTYLGIHVLSRNIIFVDLALAQISALGATVAFMLGYLPQSAAAYAYSLGFTIVGAAILSSSRNWTGRVSQETFIGVVYVVSAAAAFLLVDKSPQGAEHIKQILVGSILTTTSEDLFKVLGLYGAVGLFHWLFRQRFLLISFQPEQAHQAGWRVWFWDFLFYVSFGVVVTSSVAIGGVLLVFCFLIIPATIGTLYSNQILPKLLIGWAMGTFASSVGLGTSYLWDLPTGATIVCVFGATLALAAALKPFILSTPQARQQLLMKVLAGGQVAVLSLGLISGLWLTLNPHADQPLLDILEAYQPAVRQAFLSAEEQQLWQQSRQGEAQVLAQVGRLNELEQNSRWQGAELSDDDLRKLSSYTLSFQEMDKGEQFVQRQLRNQARNRQRWVIGLPLVLIALGGLISLGGWVSSAKQVSPTGRV
ncbi:metal ABC transporter permease [Leptolyngbya sp. FACHB-261]|uniref:metal ABC transporter permease n=1 Tax=Leptolyngbya sp. FACHB-261 TaxID=2692806 RepID=UPI001682BEE6|nr:iron chelate uptake ABC transporter family permease subunit [Leptolyngbya sp. FACHB-261]MBD2100163.1 metal ABC transporter permease [Leptolyngbya sp. FACHB-261]